MAKRRALLIGVSQYQNDAITDLPLVGQDLAILQDSLKCSGFVVEVLGGENHQDTGRSTIIQRLRKACREAKGIDTLLLYFSGHGIHYGGQDYLVPADADVSNPSDLVDYLVPTELGEVVDQCSAETILWVIDACREGVKLDTKAIGLSQWSRDDRQKATKRSLFLIFACSPGQYSQYVSGEEGFSLFTKAFAEILHPQHPACRIDTVLEATQERLNELVAEHRKLPQEIRVVNESTATNNQRSKIICEGKSLITENLPEIENCQEDHTIDEKDPFIRNINGDFFGREEELKTLRQWIVNNRCRLVGLSGMFGIGKTKLAKKLAQDIQDEFDYVIYSSLKYQNSWIEILSKWLQKFANQSTKELPVSVEIGLVRLLEKLGEYRCLLIVDDGEEVLSTGELAGKFKPEYEEYRMLLRRIGEAPHQSCLVWISREKPGEIDYLEARSKNIKSLLIEGLNETVAKKILQEKGFSKSDKKLSDLIQLYRGNPLALNLVATRIKDVFGRNIARFLSEATLNFDDINGMIESQFERLSRLEKEILFCLAKEDKTLSLADLRSQINQSGITDAVNSLKKRCLLETSESGYYLQRLVRVYLKSRMGS